MWLKAASLCAVLLMVSACAAQDDPSPSRATGTEGEIPEPLANPTPSYSNEEYVTNGNVRHVVDVYLPPEGGGPHPTILAFHGGGFYTRSKSLYTPYARHFTDQGYALVPANYRFLPDAYPAQVEDAFCALAWIHANGSRFGFDTDRIFVMGDSAGGYLAAMLGTVDTPDLYQGDCPHEIPNSNQPLGVVVVYGFFDLTNLETLTNPGRIEAFMGGAIDELPQERLAEMSPLSWVDGSEPPFLMIHGTEDQTTSSRASVDFAEALEAVGVEGRLFLAEERHAFFLNRSSENVAASLEVIDEFLGDLADS